MKAILMVMLSVASMAQAQTCPCPGSDFVLYESKENVGQGITMRRLGVPTDAAATGHLAVYGQDFSGVSLGGQPFSVTTRFGQFTGKLFALRYQMTAATKAIPPALAPLVAGGPTYDCYTVDNVNGGRFEICWTDQFGDHCGSWAKPRFLCRGTGAPDLLCYGQSRDTGRLFISPVNVSSAFPLGPVQQNIVIDSIDEYCTPVL